MQKIFRLVCGWIVIFIAIFLILEFGANIYIYYFLDEEKFGEYASIRQIVNRLQKDKNYFKVIFHPYTGYIPSPNFSRGKNRHNSYGFRGEEIGEKKEEEIWIACLGESTTYDSEIENWRKSYPAQLEKYLSEKGIKAKVINAGVDGWTSFEILIDFLLRVSRLPIDIVIYYGGLNDVGQTRFLFPVKTNILERDISDARQGIAGALNYPFWENSSFLRLILIKAGLSLPHSHLLLLNYSPEYRLKEFIFQLSTNTYPSGIFKDYPAEKILSLNEPIWFENNLRNLVLLAKSKSIQPVFVKYMINHSNKNDTLMFSEPPAKEMMKKVMSGCIDEMNTVLEKVSQELQVPLFDLPKVYPVDNPELFVDLVHNTEEGARIKAELIGEFLINEGIIKQP